MTGRYYDDDDDDNDDDDDDDDDDNESRDRLEIRKTISRQKKT